MAARRMTFLTRKALSLFLFHDQPIAISYEGLAEQLECDRSSAIIVIKRLERLGLLQKERGKGTRPNRYQIN